MENEAKLLCMDKKRRFFESLLPDLMKKFQVRANIKIQVLLQGVFSVTSVAFVFLIFVFL